MALEHLFKYILMKIDCSLNVITVCKEMLRIHKQAHNCHLYHVSVTNLWWKTNTWIYMFVLRVS
jgi:hypothetical protein